MIRRPPRSTRTDTSFPTRRSSDLKLKRGELPIPELNLLRQFPIGERPVKLLEIALNYSEGPTDGVVEAESGEPLVERFDSPSSLLYSFAWRDMVPAEEIGRAHV